MHLLLIESLDREKKLTRVLNEQQIKNDALKLQIEIERKKSEAKGENGFWSSNVLLWSFYWVFISQLNFYHLQTSLRRTLYPLFLRIQQQTWI